MREDTKFHIWRRHREGATLITVLIGIMFLSAIGLIILTVANRYMIAVTVEHNSSDNFYQTEGILEEVKTGLLEYAGDAGETAYMEVVNNYSQYQGSTQEQYSKIYVTELATKLIGYEYAWDDAKLDTEQNYDINKLKSLSTVPSAVGTSTTNPTFVIHQGDDGEYVLTLKNVLIDYTDTSNYRSTISTDIRMTVPNYQFEGDSTLDAVKDYIVISDESLAVESGATSAGVTFTGNVYTGDTDGGIQIGTRTNSKATFYSPTIISRGDLIVRGGSTVEVYGSAKGSAGSLWLQNISLKPYNNDTSSTLATSLTLNMNSYIANDLDIEANNSTVTLSGKYYGYSYNEENTSSDASTAEYSSAILINGLHTTLLSDDLDTLILAGRAFVSRNTGSNANVPDIQMGESISVKANQLAYLLPEEYIDMTDGSESHNPLFSGDSYTIDTDDLLASDIGEYLDQSEPYTANYNSSGSYSYVYYYLNFKSQSAANKYFKQYYYDSYQDEEGNTIDNKDDIEDNAKPYLTSEDGNMTFDPTYYTIAGNIVSNYNATGGSTLIQSEDYFDDSGDPDEDILDDCKQMGLKYVGYQRTLLASGSTGSMRLSENATPVVAGKIINFNKLSDTIDKTDSDSGGRIYAVNGDYVVDGSGIINGILIASGDVEVRSDFNGLIMAKGTVTTTRDDIDLTADSVLVSKLLEYAKEDEELAEIFYAYSGGGSGDDSLLDCIAYQNWEKNTY